MRPELVMKSVIPCLMAGMIGIYGLIIGLLITLSSTYLLPLFFYNFKLIFITILVTKDNYSPFKGFAHLGSGLSVGLAGLGAGMCIGVVGDAGVRANAQQPRLFTGMIMILIFAEGMKLYKILSQCIYIHIFISFGFVRFNHWFNYGY